MALNTSARIIDISPIVSHQIAVWPGDRAFRLVQSQKISDGSNIDLGSIETTLHLGAHADAPSHYMANGKTIDQVDLVPYIGPCQVIEVNIPRGQRVRLSDIGESVTSERVLFKTGSYSNPEMFNEDFNSLSPELIDALAKKGCLLVGLDTPSVDPYADKLLESHRALARTGLRNLEGLALDHVEPGHYELIALPMAIKGADAYPVRAILLQRG